MSVRTIAAAAAVLALALAPAASAQASARDSAKKKPQAHTTAKKAAAPVFYANGSYNRLVQVTLSGRVATSKTLATALSPVWWRSFYLTPTSAAGSWVVGAFSGDQGDTTDPPRLFEYNTGSRSFRWLTHQSWQDSSPVVDTEKVPNVFYVAGTTVREVSTRGGDDHQVFTAKAGWTITALAVAGTSRPYVALTHTSLTGGAKPTTYVVHLTSTPTTVVPVTSGSVTALAVSHDNTTLALSRVKPNGDSVLSLRAVAHGGLTRTLPTLGETSQLSWDGGDDTLAVDPQLWGGWTLVDIATGTTSYPTALQPYGGGVFAS